MQRPKKNSYKGDVFEKNSCGSRIPHRPHNFSKAGPSQEPLSDHRKPKFEI